jgi:pseudouridine synthase
MTERLQKFLAHAGVASRRAGERLILEGRVTVNGHVVRELGTKIDPAQDVVKVDGRRVAGPPTSPVYYVLNKPRGYVTTLHDPEGRPTVKELLRGVKRRVYPVGRLDFDSEGLLILTDDGDLAHDLMHPSRGVGKTYLAKVRGIPDAATLSRLRGGIPLDRRPTAPAQARIARKGDNAWVEIRIIEGRNRQVRRMLEAVGFPVLRLRRTAYGPLTLGRLAAGQFRPLEEAEVHALKHAAKPSRAPR